MASFCPRPVVTSIVPVMLGFTSLGYGGVPRSVSSHTHHEGAVIVRAVLPLPFFPVSTTIPLSGRASSVVLNPKKLFITSL